VLRNGVHDRKCLNVLVDRLNHLTIQRQVRRLRWMAGISLQGTRATSRSSVWLKPTRLETRRSTALALMREICACGTSEAGWRVDRYLRKRYLYRQAIRRQSILFRQHNRHIQPRPLDV